MVADQIPKRTFIFRTAACPKYRGASRPNGDIFHKNTEVYINPWWQTKLAKKDGNLRATSLLRRPWPGRLCEKEHATGFEPRAFAAAKVQAKGN